MGVFTPTVWSAGRTVLSFFSATQICIHTKREGGRERENSKEMEKGERKKNKEWRRIRIHVCIDWDPYGFLMDVGDTNGDRTNAWSGVFRPIIG